MNSLLNLLIGCGLIYVAVLLTRTKSASSSPVRTNRPARLLLSAFLVGCGSVHILSSVTMYSFVTTGIGVVQFLTAIGAVALLACRRRIDMVVSSLGEQASVDPDQIRVEQAAQHRLPWRSILNSLDLGVAVKNYRTQRYDYCNLAAANAVGLPIDALIGHVEDNLLQPEQVKLLQDTALEAIALDRPVYRAVSGDTDASGHFSIKTIALRGDDGEVDYIVTAVEDISQLQQTAAEYRRASVFLECILDNIPNTVFVKDGHNHRYLMMNKVGLDWLGFDRDEVIGKTDYDLFPEAQAKAFMVDDAKVLATQQLLEQRSERVLTRRHGLRYTRTRKLPLYDDAGSPAFVLGIAEDITDVKRAESDLQRTKAFLESIVENIPHMIFVKNAVDFRFVSVNKAAEDLLGWKRAQLIGKSDYDLFPREFADNYSEADRTAVHNGVEVDIPEEPVQSRTKGLRYLHTKKILIADEEANPIYLLGISEDITEKKHLSEVVERQQAELTHAQRLITAGEIAATLAHEFNQPVASIANYAEGALIRMESRDQTGTEMVDVFERILDLAEHAGRVVRGLRELARKQPAGDEWVDFNELARNTLRLLHGRTDRSRIQVSLDLAARVPAVRGDRTQFQQVLVNLVLNAIEALEGEPENKPRYIHLGTNVSSGGGLRVQLADNGPGFANAIHASLFKPFFTTKKCGMGLGLSICRSIVEGYRGNIALESNASGGTTVRVELPAGENDT